MFAIIKKGELNKKIKKDFKSRQKLSTLSFIVHLTMRRVLVFDTRNACARVCARILRNLCNRKR